MTATSAQPSTTTVLYLTDLHLDRAKEEQVDDLLYRISNTPSDSLILTGDISDAPNLRRHLSQLTGACAPRSLYFVTGNHDYYGGSFSDVEHDLLDLCQSTQNLHYLDGNRVIPLANGIGILGHRGWPDARAGDGLETDVQSPDRWAIKDFHGLNHDQMLFRMRSLGEESAGRIRNIFPLALTRYQHVIMATHVPPFDDAVYYDGQPADNQLLPHFCNKAVGSMMISVMKAFAHRRVSVLAGHSHGACEKNITRNLSVRVGSSRVDGMIPFELLRFAA